MKNKMHLVLLAAGTLLGSLTLAACGNTPTDTSSSEVTVSSSESTVKEYIVTFDSNGGSSVASQIIKEGELVAEPTNPTKDGYTFTNWTYNSQVWNFATDKVTQDMTLLANYTENAYGYAGTFVTDSNCSIQYIEKQSDTEYIDLGSDNVAYSRDGDTGELSHDGTGQINFKVVCKDGYTVDTVTVTPTDNYTNCKLISADTHAYRVTKIIGDVTITVTTKIDEGTIEAFKVTFVVEGGNATVTVYDNNEFANIKETGVTSTYTRDKSTGEYTNVTDNAQVNFAVIADGYDTAVSATEGAYNKIKTDAGAAYGVANAYTITKVNADITITITLTAK